MAPKVMIIIAARSLTGPAKGVFQLIKYMDDTNAIFHLFAFRSYGVAPSRFMAAADKHNIKVTLLDQKEKSYINLIRQAAKKAKENNIDIVQTHGFKPSVIGFFLRYLCHTKWICFMHGTTTENIKVRIYHGIDNVLQLFADRVVLVSKAQQKLIPNGRTGNRIRILHNAIDTDNPARLSDARPSFFPARTFRKQLNYIVAVGRLSPEKGFDILINAFAAVVKNRPSARLILVGDGQERVSLQRLVDKLALQQSVHFAGYSESPGDYMTRADVVVLPSRSEGIPNVALEAMALKKAVIATSVGGTPEVIRHNKDGILVPPENPEALAKEILELFNHPGHARELASKGRQRIEECFSPEKRISTLLSIYHELIASSPKPLAV